jgi:hypothetical protein
MPTLAVVGAGPKGIAIAAKARALEAAGLGAPRVVLIDRGAVAGNWTRRKVTELREPFQAVTFSKRSVPNVQASERYASRPEVSRGGKDVSYMERWLSRWAPLASIPAAALIVVAFFAGGSNSPDDNAPVAQVVRYYTAHASGQKVSALAGALGLVFLVFFAVALAGRVRAGGAGGWLASGVIGGAVLAVIGFLPLLTFSFILGNDIKFLQPAATQALNVLDNDYFLPAIGGFVVFGVVGGLAVAVSKAPARWMGWVLFGLGVLSAVPATSFWAFLAIFLWALVAGIWLAAQRPAGVPARERDVSLAAA